ncbi:MAG TPA: sigma-70 family RNA polymerase sigma factor [Longimicrobiales bacterium]|nr:sigma-70 family RNA polymerase sigma factor [Longimicrobiales bacterium]
MADAGHGEEKGALARTPSHSPIAVASEPMVERELILKCRAGDARFFEPLVRAYEPAALRVAMGILGHPDEARDGVQEAFIKAWQALPRFDVKRRFGPWFFQILRNHCRDMIRGRKSRANYEVTDERLEARPAGELADPERQRERAAARDIVRRALDSLVEEHRDILVLKEIQGFRYAEIAEILSIPEGTVASRLYHARRALKDALLGLGANET